jgi:hypothetical protein
MKLTDKGLQCDSILRTIEMLVYQMFTLSSPGIDSQKLLNLRTKNVQWLAAHVCEELFCW